jgi:cytochrome c6
MNSKFSLAIAICLTLNAPAFAQKGNPAHGASLFKALNCAMCHPGGNNAMEPTKPLHGAAFLKKYPNDELIAKRIREGSTNGIMPPFYKSQLPDKDLVDVIAYIRSLTPPPTKCPPVKAGAAVPRGPQGAQIPTKKGKS